MKRAEDRYRRNILYESCKFNVLCAVLVDFLQGFSILSGHHASVGPNFKGGYCHLICFDISFEVLVFIHLQCVCYSDSCFFWHSKLKNIDRFTFLVDDDQIYFSCR